MTSITPELLARLQRPGPRYTSYPTALAFDASHGERDLELHLAHAARRSAPMAAYVHFPFCEKRCTFCACHAIGTPARERVAPYLERLATEFEIVAQCLPGRRRISQLHWGGGTPTFYSADQLDAVMEAFTTHFELTDDAEVSVEVDPRITHVEQLRVLRRWGFGRISMGVQDFDPRVQAAIGRSQTEEATRGLVGAARDLGFGSVNLDLVYGLPHQSVASFTETLRRTVELRPDRLAIYGFAFVPWAQPHQRRLDASALPGAGERVEMLLACRERLLDAGYVDIGMDHFALPDDELAIAQRERRLHRNFMGYTVQGPGDMLGFGMSAIGEVDGHFYQNARRLADYRRAIDGRRLPVERGYTLTRDDSLRRTIIADIMCNFRVDLAGIARRYGVEPESYFASSLEALAEPVGDGLATWDGATLEVTELGRLFVRNVAMCFDAHLRRPNDRAPTGAPRYSQTV